MNKQKCDLVSSTFQTRKRVKQRNLKFSDVLATIVIRENSLLQSKESAEHFIQMIAVVYERTTEKQKKP